MVFMVLLVLLVLAGLAAWRGLRHLAWTLGGVALALFMLAGCGPLASVLLAGLRQGLVDAVTPSWGPRNVIVLLGGGTVLPEAGGAPQPALFAYGRLVKAASLYHDCKAAAHQCRLLISGGDSQGHQVTEAFVYAAVLRRLGCPARDLLLESHSRNTWQNARFSRVLLPPQAKQRLYLVSSAFHLRRALLYFAHFGMHPVAVSGGEMHARWSWWPQAWNIMLCDVALHEYVYIARYVVDRMMGQSQGV